MAKRLQYQSLAFVPLVKSVTIDMWIVQNVIPISYRKVNNALFSNLETPLAAATNPPIGSIVEQKVYAGTGWAATVNDLNTNAGGM